VQKWKPLLVDKMDPWEALAVDDSVLKEFLERSTPTPLSSLALLDTPMLFCLTES